MFHIWNYYCIFGLSSEISHRLSTIAVVGNRNRVGQHECEGCVLAHDHATEQALRPADDRQASFDCGIPWVPPSSPSRSIGRRAMRGSESRPDECNSAGPSKRGCAPVAKRGRARVAIERNRVCEDLYSSLTGTGPSTELKRGQIGFLEVVDAVAEPAGDDQLVVIFRRQQSSARLRLLDGLDLLARGAAGLDVGQPPMTPDSLTTRSAVTKSSTRPTLEPRDSGRSWRWRRGRGTSRSRP